MLMKVSFDYGYGNWVEILPQIIRLYNGKNRTSLKLTPVETGENLDKVVYTLGNNDITKMRARLNVGDSVENNDKMNFFS